LETGRTIFTSQGGRWHAVLLHFCDRDLGAIESGGYHLTGRFVWTALSRTSANLVLDISHRVWVQFTPNLDLLLTPRPSVTPSPGPSALYICYGPGCSRVPRRAIRCPRCRRQMRPVA
jgi:hypothetical protein